MKGNFDPCPHMLKIIVINCGRLLWPEETNITTLYNKATVALGVPAIETNSEMVNKLPSPIESARQDPNGKLTTECPNCHNRSFVLHGLCRSCKDAEGGKYKTMFECYRCGNKDKSQEPLVVWLKRLGVDFGTQTKESLGIETITDDGKK